MEGIIKKYIQKLDEIFAKEENKNAEFIYRGQSDLKWNIKSTAQRRLEKSKININKPTYDKYHTKLLKDAKAYKYEKAEGLSDIELLAQLQHLGAATGLIDFSLNFLISLWFASSNTDIDGKIFIVNKQNKNIVTYTNQNLFDENSSLEDDEKHYFIDNPFKSNKRILAQQGVFLYGYTDINVVDEIIVKNDDKKNIRDELNKMFSINEEALFQDIYGFSAINNTEHLVNKDLFTSTKNPHAQGNEFYYKKQYDDAINSYKKAIGINPKNDAAYYNMGVAYAAMKQHDDEIKSYEKAIEINPKNDGAYFSIGIAYSILKQYDDAINSVENAIAINPLEMYKELLSDIKKKKYV